FYVLCICVCFFFFFFFFFSSRRRHTRSDRDWSSDVCSSDLTREDGPHDRRRDLPIAVRQSANMAAADRQPCHPFGRFAFRILARSEERRVGKECRSRWWP